MKIEQIGTLEAKTRLSELLDEVEKGTRFVITRHATPIAELAPVGRQRKRKAGFAKGMFGELPDDFNAPIKEFAHYMCSFS